MGEFDEPSLRALLAHVPWSAAIVDAELHFVWANHLDQAMTEARLRASRVPDVVAADDAPRVIAAIGECLETGRTMRYETRGYRNGTMTGLWSTTVVRLPPSTEHGPRALLLSLDITEREEINARLERSEAQFRAVVEASPDVVLILDDQLIVRYINTLSRHPEVAAQVIGVSALSFTVPAEREAVERAMRTVLDEGRPQAYTAHSGLDRKIYATRILPFPPDADGRARAMLIARDETERVVAEERMRQAEERLQLVTADGGIQVWELSDLDGTSVSSPADQVVMGPFGPFLDRLEPADEERARAAMAALHGGAPSFTLEVRHRADGETELRDVLIKGTVAERGVDGRARRVVGTAIDISAQKRAQRERLLLREQLQQAQKLEAIGRLAGGVAHDFNNLLQVVVGQLDLATELAESTPQVVTELELAQVAVRQAADLVRRLLTFARRQSHNPELLQLDGVVADNLQMLRRVLPTAVRVRTAVPPRLAVRVDKGQMGQVLMNLCVNARDAMPDGGELLVEAEELLLGPDDDRLGDAGPGRYAALRVLDTGGGFSREALAHGVQPFFTTKGPSGSGLGLSVVAGIVGRHGGALRLDNRPSGGAMVEVVLPLADSVMTTLPPRAVIARPAARTARLLLAEDQPMVRRVVARVLSRAGFAVLSAADGREAVRIGTTAEPPIELAVLDVMMPGHNGRVVYEALAAHQPGLPVVFTTGYDDTVLDPDLLDRRGVELVPKPIDAERLIDAVRRALAAAEQAAHLGAE